MKKKIALLIVAILSLSVLAACGGGTTETATTEPAETTEAEDPADDTEEAPAVDTGDREEIMFWHYMNPEADGAIIAEMINEFNGIQDDIYVHVEFLPRDELMRQFTIGAVSGELPDVGMVDNPDHASFASMGIFADITDRFNAWDENQFLEGPMNSTILDGRIYGVPWASNCLALWYNVEMLNEAGVDVPETWSELEEAARTLGSDDVFGLAISAIGNEEGTFQYLPWLLSSGGDVNHMDSAGSMESMEYLHGLIEEGLMSREVISWTQADAQAQFAAGRAAMMINGPWQLAAMASDAPDLEFGVARVPRADDGVHASVLGGENLVITDVGNVDASWEFVQWISNPENSVRFNIGRGTFSPRSDIDNEVVFADDPFLLLFAEVLPDAQPRGPHPRWPEISNAISTALHEVLTGQKDVETAMTDAQATVDEINAE